MNFLRVGLLEKAQLINFIAKVLEDSGFNVYKNFKTSQAVVDIYAVLPTNIGDFGVVLACDNQSKDDVVGIQLLKEMEEVAANLKASKIAIVTSAYFSQQTINYASRKNIKLVDRDNLHEMAKKYQSSSSYQEDSDDDYSVSTHNVEDEFPEYSYDASDMEYLMRRRDENPIVYKNSLYPAYEQQNNNRFSLFSNKNKHQSYDLRPQNYNDYGEEKSSSIDLISVLGNPFVTVVLVVLSSYLISHLLANVMKINYGIAGLVEMIVAFILSYGLTFAFADRSRLFITRGTVIFFASLIILIILIFV